MNIMKNKISILDYKKYLNKKGFQIKKISKKKEKNFENLSKTILSSLIIISIFFVIPLAINLTKENLIYSKDF